MPKHTVWFGPERVKVDLPGGVRATVVEPQAPAAAEDALGVVADALDRPVGARPLGDTASEASRIAVVVPDATREAAVEDVILPLLSRLAHARHGPRSITIVVARGIHPAVPRADVRGLVGGEVMDALRVVQSAPDSPEMNVSIGSDEEIGDVRIHRAVAEADLVVLTGGVAPHHLAGFGGGPKAFVPGVAERGTVEAAHRLTLRTVVRPDGTIRSRAGVMDANPFREALLRVAERHGHCFLASVVVGEDGRPAGAAAGDVRAAHDEAAGLWRRLCGDPPVPEPTDLVIVGAGARRSHDLIQAHKALLAASAWAKPGAPIVWLARAPAGPGHPTLLPWFEIRGLDRHLAALRRQFHPYGLTAYSIRRLAKDHPVHVVSEIPDDVLRPMGLLPARTPKAALRRALAGDPATATVLPAA